MKRIELGRSGIEVSHWCLGTMTWGRQTDAADAHLQIDTALDHGIDFMDAAEMYPVNPVPAEYVPPASGPALDRVRSIAHRRPLRRPARPIRAD